MCEETAYALYLRLRERWHKTVMAGKEANRRDKDELFDRITRAWNRLSTSERNCAGKHASLVYHGIERAR